MNKKSFGVLMFLSLSISILPQEYELDEYTIALWHFNENNGTTIFDESNNHADGILVNNPQWIEGKYGSGVLLDGVDDYILFQHDSLLNFNRSSFSIELWIKIIANDKSDNKIIFANKDDVTTGHGLIIWIDTSNTLNARLTDYGGIGQPLVGPVLDYNRWYNVAFVRDSAVNKLMFFIDGYKVSETLDPTYIIESEGPFYMGRAGKTNGWESSCINAVIDEARISNIARVGTNIGELYDLFPISKGNSYYYNYQYSDTTIHVGTLEYIQNDSGKIFYIINDSSLTGNKINWLVE